jgi:hypothetical protein
MLGGGFPVESIERGADITAVDGGSTDSAPYYLGSDRPTKRPGEICGF